FDSAQFQGADLTGVNLSRSWLRQANLSNTQLEGIQFGELPYLRMDDTVRVCAYSPDGSIIGVAVWEEIGDGIGIDIYDTSTWKLLRSTTVTGVTSIAFSPDTDSGRMVSGHKNGKIRLWDWHCAVMKSFRMKRHTGTVCSLVYSPCGNRIASASYDRTVRLWDSELRECVFVFKGHTARVMSVRFSPDGRQLLSGSKDGTIRFWDSETGKPGVVLSPSLRKIRRLAISLDGRWIASGHKNGNVRLWDIVSDKPGPLLQDHTDLVTGIAFSPNVKLIATASRDRKEKLWDVSTGDLIATFNDHSYYIWDIAFSPDNLTIASASDDGAVRLWKASSSPSSIVIQDQIGNARQVVYSLDGLSLLSVDRSGVIRQESATTGARGLVLFELPDPESIKALTFSADSNWIATGCDDGSVRLWNSCTGAAGPVLEGHSSAVRILAYSTCGRWIASSDGDAVQLWDLHDTEQRRVLVEGGGDNWDRISDLKFSPEGHQLAINSVHGTVWFFDCHTKDPPTSKKPMKNGFMAFDFSPDGQQLALGTCGSIALWNLQSDEPNLKLKVPTNVFRSFLSMTIAYSPTGEFLASYNDDSVVLLWHRQSVEGDTETWSSTFVLCVFHGDITSLSWNPVVPTEFTTASKDGSVRLWRVSSDDEPVAVKMLWGTNLRRLCSAGVVLEGTTGLDPMHQRLLAQRGLFVKGLPDGSEYGVTPEYGVSQLSLEATDDWSNGGSADEFEDDDGYEDED
ncbi:U3 snoRNP protein, partial [Linnemannia elongata]